MKALELLAPARNASVGIAAIDCGADAVYIGAEEFGARKDAGNPAEEIQRLCDYAHRYGARIFVTVNTVIRDDELDRVHSKMLQLQEYGVDAFIIRDERICCWDDLKVPLHASTQCAIRDSGRARHFEELGCSRIILERELPLERIKEICKAVSCEVECFVHGALCVCYSGDCRLSEKIDGRSADRGECIQACRSLYDLEDSDGKTILKDKAVLSLKDLRLKDRMKELCEAGVTSFKIEGRLKNASYVKNVVREYSLALDRIVESCPELYCRASFGTVSSGFTPDSDKTFNRSYTELFFDGERGKWAAMEAPKSMGEFIGTVSHISRRDRYSCEIRIEPAGKDIKLANGDGFAVLGKGAITGFRGDVCQGNSIICKAVDGLHKGDRIYRNVSADFEKALESETPRREIRAEIDIRISDKFDIDIEATTEDGRSVICNFKADVDVAQNRERAETMLREQLSKRAEGMIFKVRSLTVSTPGDVLPLLSASTMNSLRRIVAGDLNEIPCNRRPLGKGVRNGQAPTPCMEKKDVSELMRSKYCVRFELGMCPVHQGGRDSRPLYLMNNGRRFELGFDCRHCEMTLREVQKKS